jgi:putative endonuclease
MGRACTPAVPPVSNAAKGVAAEEAACAALSRDGFTILARRARTKLGEIDIVAADPHTLAFVEVKSRPNLTEAAYALAPRQQFRLLAAAEILLGENPGWARAATRFDVVLVDAAGQIRRIKDAFRTG